MPKRSQRTKADHGERASASADGGGRKECHAHWCRSEARKDSKYCSDKCGLQLATMRIQHFLPPRLATWRETPSYAETRDREELEELAAEQQTLLKLTDELYERERLYHKMLTKAKSESVDPDWLAGEGAAGGGMESSSHETIYCVSCGSEVHLRTAPKHIEKCFNKYELYFTGSTSGLNIANVYCNRFNERDETYCKRLRVMCAEHNAEQAAGGGSSPGRKAEVCGFPLVTDVFKETGRFCRAPKAKCLRHVSWDKFRQAELDTEKVKIYVKFRENMLRERAIKSSITSRGGVLQLMLHSTTDHDSLRSENEDFIGNNQP